MKPKPKNSQAASALPPLMLGGSMWAIRAGALPRLLESAAQMPARLPAAFDFEDDEPTPAEPGVPGVAILALTGVLTPHGSLLSFLFGGGSRGVQGFRDELAAAVVNPDVAAIVLDVDSPGGSTGLIQEAAADVRAAREVKPVYAVANTVAASGAYWIASQASELHATPSAFVGSIGVYYVHEDWSRANDRLGLAVTYISEGKFKTEGNPDEPLSDEAKAAWQADAAKIYEQFVGAVAAGRGTTAAAVRDGYGEGRVLLADDALAAGMVDGVRTLQDVVAGTLASAARTPGASASRLGRGSAFVPAPAAELPAPGEPPVADPPAAPDPDPEADTDPEPAVPAEDPAPAADPDPAVEPEAEATDDPPESADPVDEVDESVSSDDLDVALQI